MAYAYDIDEVWFLRVNTQCCWRRLAQAVLYRYGAADAIKLLEFIPAGRLISQAANDTQRETVLARLVSFITQIRAHGVKGEAIKAGICVMDDESPLLILPLPPSDESKVSSASSSSKGWCCPKCNHTNDAQANYCGCGQANSALGDCKPSSSSEKKKSDDSDSDDEPAAKRARVKASAALRTPNPPLHYGQWTLPLLAALSPDGNGGMISWRGHHYKMIPDDNSKNDTPSTQLIANTCSCAQCGSPRPTPIPSSINTVERAIGEGRVISDGHTFEVKDDHVLGLLPTDHELHPLSADDHHSSRYNYSSSPIRA